VKGQPVTALTDIYGLGVVLYELLTGAKPHDFETSHPTDDELVEIVCKRLPVRPSLAVPDRHRERELRGDLDAIVIRALQKDPARRYPSVADFAEDVRRHLDRKPVRARSTEPGYTIRTSMLHDQRVRIGAIFAGIILVAVCTALWVRFDLKKRPAPAVAANDQIGIAVLPFDNFAAEKENSYFADGVQEAILTNLANVSALKVISRGSVANYRDRQKNEQDIGKALGVAYLLEGSVQKTGDHVRVDAHLVDTRNATTIWAQQYDRKLDDLFGVESELAQAIVSQLKARLSPNEKAAIEVTPTKDMVAYDLYLRARESFFQDNYPKAVQLVEEAVKRDSQFALAHALLAQVQLYMYRFNGDQTANRLGRANDAAETALRIAPRLPQSHLARAQYFYYGPRDYQGALAELSVARSLGGEQAECLDLSALIERRLGRWKDAIRDAERAAELDPQNPFVVNELVQSYISVRRFADADRTADKAIKAAITRSGFIWTLRSEALLDMGRLDDARTVIEDSPEGMSRANQQIWVAFMARDFARALQLLSDAAPTQKETYDNAFMNAVIARTQGDVSKAHSSFELARDRALTKLRDRPNDASALSSLSLADAGLGRKEEAIQEAKKAIELCPMSRDAIDGIDYESMLAVVYAWSGEQEAAITQLQKVVRLPRGPNWADLHFNSLWDELRTNAGFERLLTQAALPPVYN
jgi:serine/threonine-protein kinase